ncbi:MAG TPA: cephalosporin hydroxylase [Betaproteobacteria bacterium]|nr:cephalosporin hydroxylase [Betaproteobacteria bacterium]
MTDDHEDFLQERARRIASYATDETIKSASDGFLQESLRRRYSYNFDWLGLPIIQYPQDMAALQEIIWRRRPDLIVETGVARGGSLIFYASLLELLGEEGSAVLGIDVDLRAHNRRRILQHPLAHRVKLLDGSSIDAKTIAQVAEHSTGKRSVMVILDSNHTGDHVRAELEAYTPLVQPGGYCVVFDTVIELMPAGFYADRPWDRGDNPMTAVEAFLAAHPEWAVDRDMDNKLLVTAARSGYLRRRD